MIPLHITSSELTVLVVLGIAFIACLTYFAYTAGALKASNVDIEVDEDG